MLKTSIFSTAILPKNTIKSPKEFTTSDRVKDKIRIIQNCIACATLKALDEGGAAMQSIDILFKLVDPQKKDQIDKLKSCIIKKRNLDLEYTYEKHAEYSKAVSEIKSEIEEIKKNLLAATGVF